MESSQGLSVFLFDSTVSISVSMSLCREEAVGTGTTQARGFKTLCTLDDSATTDERTESRCSKDRLHRSKAGGPILVDPVPVSVTLTPLVQPD